MAHTSGSASSLIRYEPLKNGTPRAEPKSFGRLFVVWCASVICGGITPGQTVFTPLLADAGLFASVCSEELSTGSVSSASTLAPPRCDKQDILIASIFSSLNLISLIGLLPAGIVYDALGARKVSIIGTFLLASGLLVLAAVLALAPQLPTATQMAFFASAVICVDAGSLMQNFGFYGLLFHLPGWQALVIGLSIGCTSVAAVVPVVLSELMEATGISLGPALCGYSLVVCSSAATLALTVPRQPEFFAQAQRVLGIPVPQLDASLGRLRKSLRAAWRVLRVRPGEHFLVYAALVLGNFAVMVYASLAVSFGSALFGDKEEGRSLGKFYAGALAWIGMFVAPLCGVVIDFAGLPTFFGCIAIGSGVVAFFCGEATWGAQATAAIAAAFFAGTFVLIPTKYVVLFSPPQRFGTVQGLFIVLQFVILLPSFGAAFAIFLTGPEASLLTKYIRFTQICGVLSAVYWVAYLVRWLQRPEPGIILLEEDEREIAARFGVRSVASAQEVLGLTRKELLSMLASQDLLVQRQLQELAQSESAITRYAELCRRTAESITETSTSEEGDLGIGLPYPLEKGAAIVAGTPEEAYTVIVRSFNGTATERGEPYAEWMLESLDRFDPRRVKFLEDFYAIQAHAAHRFGRVMVAKATDGTVEAACICYPPEVVGDGEPLPIFGERWLYGVHKSGRRLMDSFGIMDTTVFSRLAALQEFELPERHRGLGRHWYVGGLAVAPGCRGRKRGTHLLKLLASWADRDAVACYLECGEVNVPFYEKCGFKCIWSATTSQGGSPYSLYGMFRPASSETPG